MTLAERLAEYVRACFTGLWVQSFEHQDALAEIAGLCRAHGWSLAAWDIDGGLSLAGQSAESDNVTNAADPLAAIRSLGAMASPDGTALLVLVNFHRFLGSPEVVQALDSQIHAGKQGRTFVVILSPVVQVPVELEKQFVVIEHDLPGRDQLEAIARSIAAEPGELPGGDELGRVLDAAAGLTRFEAEETGAIVHMGNWALKQACMDAKSWPDRIKVSVNVSAVQLETGDLYEAVVNALAAACLEPDRLQLEITETVVMRDSLRTRGVLRKLDSLGVTVALDDFGTRFSTLNCLRSFPFKEVKIDRSFVHDVSEHPHKLAIVRSIADLASELNMRSVAEGVETAADLAAVSVAGYDAAQGFYFSLPVPARAFRRTIAQCAAKFETHVPCNASKTAA